MSVYVPKQLAGYYLAQQLHEAHDAKDAEIQHAAERALPPAAGNDQSAKPRAQALGRPRDRGSRHRPDLMAQVVINGTTAKLLMPATHMPPPAANAFTPTINVGGASSTAPLSSAMFKGVNATRRARFETSTVAAAGARSKTTLDADRERAQRFFISP